MARKRKDSLCIGGYIRKISNEILLRIPNDVNPICLDFYHIPKKEYVIDGNNFSNINEFYDEIISVFHVYGMGRNLDAFNDILRGRMSNDTIDDNFTVVWLNSNVSKERLGHQYRIQQLQQKLKRCHESWYDQINQQIKDAQNGTGKTTFDELVEIILCKGTGHDNVDLLLD
eukprot:481406_1